MQLHNWQKIFPTNQPGDVTVDAAKGIENIHEHRYNTN